jgi:hypothetical protein
MEIYWKYAARIVPAQAISTAQLEAVVPAMAVRGESRLWKIGDIVNELEASETASG